MAAQPDNAAPPASEPALKPAWSLISWEDALREQLLPAATCDLFTLVGMSLFRADSAGGPSFVLLPGPLAVTIDGVALASAFASPPAAARSMLDVVETCLRRAGEALDEAAGAS